MHFLNLHSAPPEVMHDHWFAGLPQQLQAQMLQACHRRIVRPQHSVYTQDQAVKKRLDGLYVLIEGELNLYATTPAGRESVLSIIKPGQWFGEMAMLDGLRRECEIRASVHSVVGVMDTEHFQQLKQDTAFTAKVAELLSGRTRLYMSILEDLVLRSPRARTARRLLLLSHGDNMRSNRIYREVSVSHDTLASMLGMTRQTLGQQLRALATLGAISQGYGRIEIASTVALMVEASAA